LGRRLTISGQKTIYVKRLNGGCQKREELTPVMKDVKALRGPQTQGIENKVKFLNMVCHGQYLSLQVLDLSLNVKHHLQKWIDHMALIGNKIHLHFMFKIFIY
jgi:hypothetical protein